MDTNADSEVHCIAAASVETDRHTPWALNASGEKEVIGRLS